MKGRAEFVVGILAIGIAWFVFGFVLGARVADGRTPTAPDACRVYEDGSAVCPHDTFRWDPPENGERP